MYKRKQKGPPSFLSLTKSSRSDKSNVPGSISEAVIEENIENHPVKTKQSILVPTLANFRSFQDNVPAPANADAGAEADAHFLIPASQQTSQRRYFSQRSNMNRSQAVGTQNTTSRKVPSSYFENSLLRCGVIFDNPQYFIIGCDHINFVNKLRTMLRSAPDYPTNIERFLTGLREYMKEEQQMAKVLTVCMVGMK